MKVTKAKEVLRRYAAGERDFRGLNLRGQSFKGADLSGADFSEADLRSTKFNGSTLKGVNFTGAKCGLQKIWTILVLIISWISAGMLGIGSLSTAYLVLFIFEPNSRVVGYLTILLISISWIFSIIKGIGNLRGVKAILGGLPLGGIGLSIAFFSQDLKILIALTISVLAALAIPLALSLAIVINEKFAVLSIPVISITVIIAASTKIELIDKEELLLAAIFALAGLYLNLFNTKKDDIDNWARYFAVTFASIGGTSFLDANLTEANFKNATLQCTDLRNTNLTRVCWYHSKILDRGRPGNTYLKSAQVRQWLIGKGKDKNFNGQKLQGINLEGADLAGASFIDANLSEANLSGANLTKAQLIQTQLDNTDLRGANLTGACLEDWGITTHTKLDNVECQYVFMRSPTEDDPNPRRKPDNWEEDFIGNDFAEFIKPIFDTLDLYHNQGVDPRAIAIAWKELAENNPDANLRFASMEVKGEDKLLLRLKTSPNANLSKLNQAYFQQYNEAKALNETQKQLLLAQDNRIKSLEIMVNNAIESPKFNIERAEGEILMGSEKRDINIGQGNYNEKIEGNYYEQSGSFGIGHMSGGEIRDNAKVAGTINEAEQQDLVQAAEQIQQLLAQLEKDNPSEIFAQKGAIADLTIAEITNNPSRWQKPIKVIKAMGIEALAEAVNNPIFNIAKAGIEAAIE